MEDIHPFMIQEFNASTLYIYTLSLFKSTSIIILLLL